MMITSSGAHKIRLKTQEKVTAETVDIRTRADKDCSEKGQLCYQPNTSTGKKGLSSI